MLQRRERWWARLHGLHAWRSTQTVPLVHYRQGDMVLSEYASLHWTLGRLWTLQKWIRDHCPKLAEEAGHKQRTYGTTLWLWQIRLLMASHRLQTIWNEHPQPEETSCPGMGRQKSMWIRCQGSRSVLVALTGGAGFDKILNVPVNVWPPHYYEQRPSSGSYQSGCNTQTVADKVVDGIS